MSNLGSGLYLTFLLYLSLILPNGSEAIGGQGIYFVPIGERYVSHSSWLVTFTFDLNPYHQHIDELKAEIERFYDMFVDFAKVNISNALETELLFLLDSEKHQFEQEYEAIVELWEGIQTITSKRKYRDKRAILPFVSTILKQLLKGK